MPSASPIVHAFRRRSAAVLLFLAAVVPASAYAQMPVVTPVISWSKSDAEALIRVIEAAAEEGLEPGDYGLEMLRQAILREAPAHPAFTEAALRLASDFRYGRVPGSERVDWHGEAPN